jgi:hypothetical protein
MINDGRMFSQYFLGWPLLMVPGLWIGLPAAANALYSALTVFPLYGITERFAGRRGAQLGILLYLLSPFLMISAATLLSHTSCIMALTWMIWFFFRLKDRPKSLISHTAMAFFFCLAFFIRPLVAMGLGIPFVLTWAIMQLKRSPRQWIQAIIPFGVVCGLMGVLFLWINQIQCGHPLKTAYQRYVDYSILNECRFSLYRSVEIAKSVRFACMDFSNLLKAIAAQGVALFRMNYSLWGWPAALIFVPFGIGCKRLRIFVASVGCFLVFHLFVSDSGIDAYGPVHYTELSIPLILFTVVGIRAIYHKLSVVVSPNSGNLIYLPIALLAALILTSCFGTTPVRLMTLFQRTAQTAKPFNAVQQFQLKQAVIFAPYLFAPLPGNSGFVFYRPNNHPDLTDNILWVNHISLEDDRRFMKLHPGRTGHVMIWLPDLTLGIIPLNELQEGQIPNGRIGGSGRGPDWNAIEQSFNGTEKDVSP